MKALKILSLFILSVFVGINLTACSNDDEEVDYGFSTSIVGTWTQQNVSGYSNELTFTANGTCSQLYTLDSARLKYKGNYNIKGKTLTVIWNEYKGWNFITKNWIDLDTDPETFEFTISIVDNKMTLSTKKSGNTQNTFVYTKE